MGVTATTSGKPPKPKKPKKPKPVLFAPTAQTQGGSGETDVIIDPGGPGGRAPKRNPNKNQTGGTFGSAAPAPKEDQDYISATRQAKRKDRIETRQRERKLERRETRQARRTNHREAFEAEISGGTGGRHKPRTRQGSRLGAGGGGSTPSINTQLPGKGRSFGGGGSRAEGGLKGAFQDPNLVGSKNEIDEFDGSSFAGGGFDETTTGAAGGGTGSALFGREAVGRIGDTQGQSVEEVVYGASKRGRKLRRGRSQ